MCLDLALDRVVYESYRRERKFKSFYVSVDLNDSFGCATAWALKYRLTRGVFFLLKFDEGFEEKNVKGCLTIKN